MSCRIVLHMGTQKTGSTALQHFLHRNRGRLLEDSICYGRAFNGEKGVKSLLLGGIRSAVETSQEDIEMFAERVAADVVTGAEELWYSEENLFPIIAHFDTSFRAIRGIFSSAQQKTGVKLHVVPRLYIRRQDEFISSLYQEEVKCLHHAQSLSTWAFGELMDFRCNYLVNARVLSRVFDEVQYKPYGQVIKAGGIISEFCASYGLDEARYQPTEHVNESLEAHATEALRQMIDSEGLDSEASIARLKVLRSTLNKDRRGKKLDLRMREKAEVMQKYANSNRLFVEHFASSCADELFAEPEVRGLSVDELSRGRVAELVDAAYAYASEQSTIATSPGENHL